MKSRFQRWLFAFHEPWGEAPGWYEDALLALSR